MKYTTTTFNIDTTITPNYGTNMKKIITVQCTANINTDTKINCNNNMTIHLYSATNKTTIQYTASTKRQSHPIWTI